MAPSSPLTRLSPSRTELQQFKHKEKAVPLGTAFFLRAYRLFLEGFVPAETGR